MTAIGARPASGGNVQTRENVRRPNGSLWRGDPRYPSRAYTEHTKNGPVVLVLRTWDRVKARRLAEVRWQAFYPDLPMPEGELEWRRHASSAAGNVSAFAVGESTGGEARSYPVVAFKASAVTA